MKLAKAERRDGKYRKDRYGEQEDGRFIREIPRIQRKRAIDQQRKLKESLLTDKV